MLNFPEKTLKPTLLYVSRNIWLKAEFKTAVVLFVAFPIKLMAGRPGGTPGDTSKGLRVMPLNTLNALEQTKGT